MGEVDGTMKTMHKTAMLAGVHALLAAFAAGSAFYGVYVVGVRGIAAFALGVVVITGVVMCGLWLAFFQAMRQEARTGRTEP